MRELFHWLGTLPVPEGGFDGQRRGLSARVLVSGIPLAVAPRQGGGTFQASPEFAERRGKRVNLASRLSGRGKSLGDSATGRRNALSSRLRVRTWFQTGHHPQQLARRLHKTAGCAVSQAVQAVLRNRFSKCCCTEVATRWESLSPRTCIGLPNTTGYMPNLDTRSADYH